jgi:aldehyde dehydrogenase (NAD+)
LIGGVCGRNLVPVKLELGGKGAAVVFADVNVKSTVEALVRAVTYNSGQVCCTATRWLVERPVFDEFAALAAQRMAAVRIGYWNSLRSEMGPLISARQLERVLDYLDRAREEGATELVPGGPAEVAGREAGFFVKPALLTGPADNIACREEIFGPVAYLLPFDSEEEAVALVNSSPYGLANSVWTTDAERCARLAPQLAAGTCWLNCHNVYTPGVPYAGINLSGLGGGVLGEGAFYDYLRPIAVSGSV